MATPKEELGRMWVRLSQVNTELCLLRATRETLIRQIKETTKAMEAKQEPSDGK